MNKTAYAQEIAKKGYGTTKDGADLVVLVHSMDFETYLAFVGEANKLFKKVETFLSAGYVLCKK